MSLEIIGTCDDKNCRNRIDYYDEFYCKECYLALLARIDELENELTKKEEA